MTGSAHRAHSCRAVFVGGSAGAFDALRFLLASLPRSMLTPVVAVIHLPPGSSRLAEVLQGRCSRPVEMAVDKQPLKAGSVILAPADYHLLVDDGPRLALSVDPPVHHARPSIDVLLQSGARVLGAGAAGVILSGASEDGALGLAAIARVGGVALVQDPAEAAFATMPRAAIRQCPHAAISGLAGIASALALAQETL